jgi:hypothetical protein
MKSENPPTPEQLDASLRIMVRQIGPQGALAILAFGDRAVRIWREEFPRDWEALRIEQEKLRSESHSQKPSEE